jgi:hypothetical protein
MPNIAGKSAAINVVTPVPWRGLANRLIFWFARQRRFQGALRGLETLSLIHYARWVIVGPQQFPHLDDSQPLERLRYGYEMFFSNFNGSWNQYIDSFSMAIPGGLDLLWFKNVGYPQSVPIATFHRYINAHETETDYYYNAYPLASSNDVKSAERVRLAIGELQNAGANEFEATYLSVVRALQHDLTKMDETPIVSLANLAANERQRRQGREQDALLPRSVAPLTQGSEKGAR